MRDVVYLPLDQAVEIVVDVIFVERGVQFVVLAQPVAGAVVGVGVAVDGGRRAAVVFPDLIDDAAETVEPGDVAV
ncbi:MAG: hypothetical protein GX594_09195 [Pirellulaceae bacterium]|nr:hypothetical protein [Pirellulaceae bacterium]